MRAPGNAAARLSAPAIEIAGLSKGFGAVQAVRSLSFTARPGRVTGFLGPNGSGKTTTLSMLLGLTRPDTGTALIGGVPYAELEHPAITVGSSLSASFHPAHTARAHLDIVRRATGAPAERVAEVLDLVGLEPAADRRTGGFSLGMRQRLALGAALIGDPPVVVLDEPINGLDPEGIRWIRELLRHFAGEGRTVLLSSHLLGEVEQTVDDVVVIRGGELAFAGALAELRRTAEHRVIRVSGADGRALASALATAGAEVRSARPETGSGGDLDAGAMLRVTGIDAPAVGVVALQAGVALTHLSVEQGDLEERFLALIAEGAPAADPVGSDGGGPDGGGPDGGGPDVGGSDGRGPDGGGPADPGGSAEAPRPRNGGAR